METLPGPGRARRGLSLGGVPARSASREQPAQPRPHRGCAQAMSELGLDLDEIDRAGGGARPRQRRARAARVVLHGLARVGRGPRHRLRHPLRVRHFRSGHPRRLAGARSPTNGCATATRGRSPRPGDRVRSEVRRTHRAPGPTSRAAVACAGFPRPWSKASPTTRRSSATASAPATRCACGRPRPSSRSISPRSITATTTARSRTRWRRRTSRRCSIRTTRSHQGKELRLKQQFFFSSCSLQDMLRIHALLGGTLGDFHEKWAVQLNDTHPGGRGRRADAAARG